MREIFSTIIVYIYLYISGCEDLGSPLNENVVIDGTGIGAVAIYTCQSGYLLQGTQIRVCDNEERWSGSVPTCALAG